MKPALKKHSALEIDEGQHLLRSFNGDPAGPTLIVVGSIHGNEPAGVLALRRIADELDGLSSKLRGRVYFLAGNTRAINKGLRFIDHDLNRAWTRRNLSPRGSEHVETTSEGHELRELDSLIDSILVTAKSEVYIMDLHSTSATGQPFATVGDTLRNRSFAMGFGVTILLGIEEQLEGTMLEHFNNLGAVTLGFEGGSHDSPETVENHRALVWLGLVNSGILTAADVPDLKQMAARLTATSKGMRIVEVRHREAIRPEDNFEMNPGFNNFDRITEGQTLAKNRSGEIRAVESGMILMPLYQKLGEDGFFIGRSVAPFWLWLSAVMRRLRVQNILRYLPGVRVDPDDSETLYLNTGLARFFPLQVSHLLGFRKRRFQDRELVVSRRRFDLFGPFTNRS
ncbi:MAG: succinylglutamate desuccinylase/aspartoacylase family protein [Pyrinomonadaceae bacterium]|nr:succinylglutamate desuccinylase/aspartoacylase family protein [Pyrinomonadaceae bacterium]